MAESAQRKVGVTSTAKKNPVHRTTTETMRLETMSSPTAVSSSSSSSSSSSTTAMTCAQSQCPVGATGSRKKTSSFQITSVTVGARASNDAGEDSNDDLDESHTEDNSRLTDIDLETPSYSEDTFSKEDVFFNAGNAALSTAPVIPTSSQYGLAIVPNETTGPANSNNENNINTLDIASVTENNIINLLAANAKQDTDLRDVHSHARNERFKVVKIESTEPFKRGRWTCMDYLDHTSVNQATAISTPKVSDPNEVCISYGVTDSGIVIPDSGKQSLVSDCEKAATIGSVDSNGQVSHQELLTAQQMSAGSTGYVPSSLASAAPPGGTQPQPTSQMSAGSQPMSASSQIPTSSQMGPPAYFTGTGSQQAPTTTQPQPPPQQQGATLPANLASATIGLMTQASNSGALTKDEGYSSATTNVGLAQAQSQGGGAPAQSQPSMIVPGQQQQQQPAPDMATVTMQAIPSIHKVPQTAATAAPLQSQVIGGTSGSQAPVQMAPQPQVSAGVIGGIQTAQPTQAQAPPPSQQQPPQQQQQQQQPPQQPNVAFHQPDTEQDSVTGMIVGNAQQSADAALLESLAEVTQTGDEQHTLEDNESMSGTSAVAIDNKIEQAMDLVKSHLMFAVREEVEVLKEKIAELMDRINQLEAENALLKANATPETLAQLSQTTAKLSLNNSGSGQ